MKKIAVLLLLVVTLAGCGKKESGVFTVQNDSSHTVTFGIGQDHKVEKYSVESGRSKDIPWKQYILFYPISPTNIISHTQTNNKAVIKDKAPIYDYIIKNDVCNNLNILDGIYKNGNISEDDRKFLLSENGSTVDKIEMQIGETVIKCFNELNTKDIILLGKELTISSAESASKKEEKCRECNTEEGRSFFYKIGTNSDGKKEFIKEEILIEIKSTSTNRYVYLSLY